MSGRLDNRHEIELAEGISVHLRPASMVPRVLARLIDVTTQSLVVIVLSIVIGLTGMLLGSEVAGGLNLLLGFVVPLSYDPIFELSKHAATPGKRIMKLKVVKLSGAPTDFGASFMRALLLPIDYLPCGLAGIWASLATKHSQRLGDLAAGTLVVHRHEELHGEITDFSIKSIRPNIPLQREEQIAFLEFGRRYKSLSADRKNEITESLSTVKGQAVSGVDYALGVAHWLNENEA